jgi:hypothetical protein
MRKKHGSAPKLHTCSGLDSHNEQKTLAFEVPLQTELWFPLRRYEQPHSEGEGLRSNGRPTNGTPSPAPAAATTTTSAPGGSNSGSTDLRADAAARRPPPAPKLVRQGRAEGRRVGGQSVAGPGYLARSRTSSSCRGGCRRRERLRSHSRPKARHAAAASATDDGRPSLRSLSEGASRRPRRGRPQLGTLPSSALVMKILEAKGGAEAAARLAFPLHQAGGRHLGQPPVEGCDRAA